MKTLMMICTECSEELTVIGDDAEDALERMRRLGWRVVFGVGTGHYVCAACNIGGLMIRIEGGSENE